jgi:hypothetical protein
MVVLFILFVVQFSIACACLAVDDETQVIIAFFKFIGDFSRQRMYLDVNYFRMNKRQIHQYWKLIIARKKCVWTLLNSCSGWTSDLLCKCKRVIRLVLMTYPDYPCQDGMGTCRQCDQGECWENLRLLRIRKRHRTWLLGSKYWHSFEKINDLI